MNKTFIIAPYGEGKYSTLAMYESDDFRLGTLTNKVSGVYEKTSIVKGIQNGQEVGVFHGDNHKEYLVFSDGTAVVMPYKKGKTYSILFNGAPTVAKFLGTEFGDKVFEIVGTTQLVFRKSN